MAIYYLVSSIYKYIYCICMFAPRQKTLNLFSGMLILKYSRFLKKNLHFPCGPQTSTKPVDFVGAGGAGPFWFWFLGLVLHTGVKGSDGRLVNHHCSIISQEFVVEGCALTVIVGQISNFVCVGGGENI